MRLYRGAGVRPLITITKLLDAIDVIGTVPCHSAPDLYSVDEDIPGYLRLMNYARELCQSCPVIELCAEYAIANDERFGIWGGMSPNERYKATRSRGLPARAIAPVLRDV